MGVVFVIVVIVVVVFVIIIIVIDIVTYRRLIENSVEYGFNTGGCSVCRHEYVQWRIWVMY